jgi:arylsulfatase
MGGTGNLIVDGKPVARGRFARTIGYRMSLDETLDVGEDTGTPVSEDYHVPFKFTGQLERVVIELGTESLTEEQKKKLAEIRSQSFVAD